MDEVQSKKHRGFRLIQCKITRAIVFSRTPRSFKAKKCLGVRTQKKQHQAVYRVLKLKWLHYLKILSKERPSWKQLSKANQNTGLVYQEDQREPQLTAVSVSKFVFFFSLLSYQKAHRSRPKLSNMYTTNSRILFSPIAVENMCHNFAIEFYTPK